MRRKAELPNFGSTVFDQKSYFLTVLKLNFHEPPYKKCDPTCSIVWEGYDLIVINHYFCFKGLTSGGLVIPNLKQHNLKKKNVSLRLSINTV